MFWLLVNNKFSIQSREKIKDRFYENQEKMKEQFVNQLAAFSQLKPSLQNKHFIHPEQGFYSINQRFFDKYTSDQQQKYLLSTKNIFQSDKQYDLQREEYEQLLANISNYLFNDYLKFLEVNQGEYHKKKILLKQKPHHQIDTIKKLQIKTLR